MTMTPKSRPTINVVTPDISEKNDCAVDAMLPVNPAGSVMMFMGYLYFLRYLHASHIPCVPAV